MNTTPRITMVSLLKLTQVQAASNALAQQWIINPMVGNYNPGTRQDQETFRRKTKGLPEDKQFSVLQKEAPDLKKLLKGMETSMGGIVTCTTISYNNDGTVKDTVNLITQHQLAKLELLQRQAYKRYVGLLAGDAELSKGPWEARVLNLSNSIDNQNTFHDQVHSSAVSELIKSIITPTGLTKILEGHADQ